MDKDKKTDNFFGLIEFENDIKFNEFKTDINNFIKKHKYINKNFNFDNNNCECLIEKEEKLNWLNKTIYKYSNNNIKNKNISLLILHKYNHNIYFFEISGNIHLYNKFENYNISRFDSTKGKILYKLLDYSEINDSLTKHIKAVIEVIEHNSDNEKDKICQDLVLLFYNNKELVSDNQNMIDI